MQQIELDALSTIVHCLPDIVEQLKIMNKLKAIEMTWNNRNNRSHELNANIDSAMKGE